MQTPIKKMLVAIDGSKNATAALQVAVSLAKDYRAELIILHVLHVSSAVVSASSISGVSSASLQPVYENEEKSAKRIVDEAVEFARKHGANARGQIVNSTPSIVEPIVETAANENVDIIVIGTRGIGGFKRLLMGSVSSGVVTHAHCTVLVVR